MFDHSNDHPFDHTDYFLITRVFLDNKLGSLSPAGHGPDDIAVIPYSSGTTGLPKGVQLTHRNLTSNCEMMNAPLPDERVIRAATSDFQDIVPCVLPIHHLYGLVALTFSKLSLGCKLVTLPSFDPLVFLQMIGDHRATFLPLVPSLLLFLANDERAQRQHLEHVRIIMLRLVADPMRIGYENESERTNPIQSRPIRI